MRRYDIISGILLILSIIDFALAAPVPVQEKREAHVDVAHMPKDVITILEKRGQEELETAVAEYFKTLMKSAETSDAHASSSSAPLGPDHGPTNVAQESAQEPAPNPTANPGLLMQPSSPLSTSPVEGSAWDENRFNPVWNDKVSNEGSEGSDMSTKLMFTPGSSEYGSDHEWAVAPKSGPNLNPSADADPNFDWDHWSSVVNQSPPKEVGHAGYSNPNLNPSADADPNFDWEHWTYVVNQSPPKEVGHAHGYSNPGLSKGWTGADPNFDYYKWADELNPLALSPGVALPRLRLTTKLDKDPNLIAGHTPSPYPGYPLTPTGSDGDSVHGVNPSSPNVQSPTETYSYSYPGKVASLPLPDARLPTVPEHELAPLPLPGLGSPKEPENEVMGPPSPDIEPLKEPENDVVPEPPTSPNTELPQDHQLSSADPQPVDLLAAIEAAKYAMKGKAKVSE